MLSQFRSQGAGAYLSCHGAKNWVHLGRVASLLLDSEDENRDKFKCRQKKQYKNERQEVNAVTEATLDSPVLFPIFSAIPLNFFFPFALL